MSFEGWIKGVPPPSWVRIVSYDVGGATANALNWAALCPDTQSLVFYDEVHAVTTNIREVAAMALPKMKAEGATEEYNFLAKVGDYENRVALADMGRYGITFTNAVKHDKNLSVHRFSGYLHPNPKRPFPSWHPLAGQFGAPLAYFTVGCPNLIKEIPQQRWKPVAKGGSGDSVKDEMDRTVKHDHVDCALYICRILPAPATIPIPVVKEANAKISLQSQMYWEAVARRKAEKENTVFRKPYSPTHTGGMDWKSQLS